MFIKQAPNFLTRLTPACNELYQKRWNKNAPLILFKNDFFKDVLFSSAIIVNWEKNDPFLRKSASYSKFKNNILKFTRPSPNEV